MLLSHGLPWTGLQSKVIGNKALGILKKQQVKLWCQAGDWNPDLSVNLRRILGGKADYQIFSSVLSFSPTKFPLLWLIQYSTQSSHCLSWLHPLEGAWQACVASAWKGNRASSDPSPSESLSSRGVQKKPLQTTEQPAALGRKLLPLGKSGNGCLWFLVEMTNQNQSISMGKVKGKKQLPLQKW